MIRKGTSEGRSVKLFLSFVEYLCMTRLTKSIIFWTREMLSKTGISCKPLFESNTSRVCCKNNFALIVFYFVSGKLQMISTMRSFLQICGFVDMKVVGRSSNNCNKWWKKHHLIDSHNFSSFLSWWIQLLRCCEKLLIWKCWWLKKCWRVMLIFNRKVLTCEKVFISLCSCLEKVSKLDFKQLPPMETHQF